jgi:hypothetical protein
LQINPRDVGSPSFLSGFLTGITVSDPVTGTPRTLNDLHRRNDDLKRLVCTTGTAPLAPTQRGPSFIAKGIGRVH